MFTLILLAGSFQEPIKVLPKPVAPPAVVQPEKPAKPKSLRDHLKEWNAERKGLLARLKERKECKPE